MEVPENIYNWLKATGLFQLQSLKGKFILPSDLASSLESGQAFVKLLKYMNQVKVTVTQNKLDRLTTPMPEVNTLKNATTPAARLYNWNVLTQALELFGIDVDADTKSLIIAGDRDMITEILKSMSAAENGGFQKKSTENGVDIDSIDNEKLLTDTESCVEYLIVSFINNFTVTPKQAAGLLAQGGKYLAHIVAKGLKGDFEPVKIWLQEIYASTGRLSNLIVAEQESGAANFILSSLKPGILSKDLEVVQWTLRVLSRLVLDLSDKELLGEVWNWFTGNNVLELCLLGLKRTGQEVNTAAIELLLQIGQYNYIDFFTLQLKNLIADNSEYIAMVTEFLQHIAQSESTAEEISNSGVVAYWVEMGISEAEAGTGKNRDSRASGMCFLMSIIRCFYTTVEENENTMNSILGLINRTCRDESEGMKYMAIGMLFYLLDFLANKKSAFAPIVYRILTFLLVETYSINAMREFIQQNFVQIFNKNPGIPIGIILDPYIKKLQVSDISLEIFDYDFLSVLSESSQLTIKNGIQVIDIIGKYYLNEVTYSKASGVPFTHIASRFIQQQAMQDYLYMFIQYSLNIVVETELQKTKGFKNPKPRKPKADKTEEVQKPQISPQEKIQQRNRILDMVSWVIQQWQDVLNEKIKTLLLQKNYAYSLSVKSDCKSVLVVLELLGNTEELLREFHDLNPTLFPVDDDSKEKGLENYQIVPVVEALTLKRRGNFPWERVVVGLEKAKQKKIMKDLKVKEEEERAQKALEFKKKHIKKQLEMRKIEQAVGKSESAVVFKEGIVQKYIAQVDEIVLREFSGAESDLEEAVKLMISKYSRVFKLFFSKYSGTGFEKKFNGNPSFDLHAKRKSKVNDAEYIKILKDYGAIPKLLSKEELRTIMRTYNHRIAKQAEQSYVDYKGFKGVFCQIAYFVHSRKPADYSHLPPVVSLRYFLNFIRDSMKSRGENTEVFDEPDPGTGDKDVVRSLNKLLAKDPKTAIPEGYEKITDKEVRVFFSAPRTLGLPPSFSYSIELLDEILDKSLGIRILEPQVEYFTSVRVKGTAPKKEKIDLPPIYERTEAVKKKPSVSVSPPPPAKTGKLSSALKLQLARVPAKDKDRYEECAYVLEDLLHSVKLNMKRVINRNPKIGAQQEKFEALKEREKAEDANKKIEEERKRKARQQKLLDELNLAKEQRKNMLREEEERKRRGAVDEEYRKRESEEKEMREKREVKRKLEEWAAKRENEKKSEGEKKRKDEEFRIAEEVLKRNNDRLENAIREKELKAKQAKRKEKLIQAKEQREKDEKKERGIRNYLESKNKDETKADTKKEFIMLLNNPEVKSCIAKNSEQIGEIFTFYLRQMGEELPADSSINSELFNKFCTEFGLFSVITQEDTNNIFLFLTKKKRQAVMNDDEFQRAIVLLANKARESLDIEESGIKPLEVLLDRCEISVPIKSLKKKLGKLKQKIVMPVTKKKTMSLSRVLGKKKDKRNNSISTDKFASEISENPIFETNKSINFPGKLNNSRDSPILESNKSINSIRKNEKSRDSDRYEDDYYDTG